MKPIEAVRDRLSTFTVPATSTRSIAEALAAHLRGIGDPADVTDDGLRVDIETRAASTAMEVVLVRVATGPKTMVLVHSDGDLRPIVQGYQELALPPHLPLLVTTAPVDAPLLDCRHVFEPGIAAAEGALRFLTLDAPIATVFPDRLADVFAVLRDLAAHLGVEGSLFVEEGASGIDAATPVLDVLDAMALAIRPAVDGPIDRRAVYPLYTLMGMALVAAATAAVVLETEPSLGTIDDQGQFRPVATLGEAGGFPAVGLEGVGALQIGRKLVQRWFEGAGDAAHGSASASELFEAWCAMRPEPDDPA